MALSKEYAYSAQRTASHAQLEFVRVAILDTQLQQTEAVSSTVQKFTLDVIPV